MRTAVAGAGSVQADVAARPPAIRMPGWLVGAATPLLLLALLAGMIFVGLQGAASVGRVLADLDAQRTLLSEQVSTSRKQLDLQAKQLTVANGQLDAAQRQLRLAQDQLAVAQHQAAVADQLLTETRQINRKTGGPLPAPVPSPVPLPH